MIGVICKKSEYNIVYEFFELFKTPWEFYKAGIKYDVIISTDKIMPDVNPELLLLFFSEQCEFDNENNIEIKSRSSNLTLQYEEENLPIYGNIITFNFIRNQFLSVKDSKETAGIVLTRNKIKVIRIGYDVFWEIQYLFTFGQPSRFSHIPTMEIHIALIRKWILQTDIPLIEIPPVFSKFKFAVCLTHDVDFVHIRKHIFDVTFWGFFYRSFIASTLKYFQRKTSRKKLIINLLAVLNLPLVYLGIKPDFWVQFDHYLEIEKERRSTFFIIPYKNSPGFKGNKLAPKRRAVRYDISDISSEIKMLLLKGCEIGLHGIDAWNDPARASKESERISEITGQSASGVRIHWLYFNKKSPNTLEKAGFLYDSTIGYNESVGFKAGTSQVYRHLNAEELLELPLIIQDTALFYSKRMNLSELEAWPLVCDIVEKIKKFNGVLTINWHQRSLAPERLWDDFYTRLLDYLKKERCYFATANEIVGWFRKRREAKFEKVDIQNDRVKIKISCPDDPKPDLVLRIYHPNFQKKEYKKQGFTEIPFSGKLDKEILLH